MPQYLTTTGAKVLSVVTGGGETTIPALASDALLAPAEVRGALSELQDMNLVTMLDDGQTVRATARGEKAARAIERPIQAGQRDLVVVQPEQKAETQALLMEADDLDRQIVEWIKALGGEVPDESVPLADGARSSARKGRPFSWFSR